MNNIYNYTNNKKAKLYIIKSQNKIVYVGIASQPIDTRLRQGLNPYIKKDQKLEFSKKGKELIIKDWE